MDKFRNKYRIQSSRLQNWDYGSNAMYYITICTHNRKHHFGKIEEAIMILSEIGNISHRCLYDIPNHFPFIIMDEMVIMPNHIHGIFIIENNVITNCDMLDESLIGNDFVGDEIMENNPLGHNSEYDPIAETPKLGVSTDEKSSPITDASSNPTINPKHRQTINASKKWQPGIIGVVINQFKRAVTIDARKINPSFGWQSRYYDHIIRDEADYWRIKKYIIDNPNNWEGDDFNKT